LCYYYKYVIDSINRNSYIYFDTGAAITRLFYLLIKSAFRSFILIFHRDLRPNDYRCGAVEGRDEKIARASLASLPRFAFVRAMRQLVLYFTLPTREHSRTPVHGRSGHDHETLSRGSGLS